MKLCHCGDLHITEHKGDSYATLEDQVSLLRWIGTDAAEAGAEVILCGGDVYDTATTPAERAAAIDVFSSWSDALPVVAVVGNHDKSLDVDVLGRIRTKHPITVVDTAHLVRVAGLQIACISWPRKSWLAAQLPAGADLTAVAVQAMRALLLGFAAQWSGDDPRVLLAHLQLGGALSDAGQPLVGTPDVELAPGDLVDTEADAILLSHIHKFQQHGDRIVYAGSPRQMTFGESLPKGYCLVDVRPGMAPIVEHRQGPGRRLVTLNLNWDPDAAGLVPDAGEDADALSRPNGCAIRLSYEVPEDQREAAHQQAVETLDQLLASGAHSVKLDARTIATHRVRSEEIRAARSTSEKLEALWTSRGQRPGRAEAILGKLSALEQEVLP